MRAALLFLLLVPACCMDQHAMAQELVVNGGMEEFDRCPKGPVTRKLQVDGRVQAAQGDPDLYSVCSLNFGVPKNWSGAQPAWEGKSYAGLVLTTDMPDDCGQREYLQFPLVQPLENGRRYRLTFRVSVADRAGYYTDRIGAIFSSQDHSRKGLPASLRERADMENPLGRMLDDTTAWATVSGLYNATGGERYVVVGNFHPCNSSTRKTLNPDKRASIKRKADARMDPVQQRGAWHEWITRTAYVYLDGVSLVPDTTSPETVAGLGAQQACPPDVPNGNGPELIPDPSFDHNTHPTPNSWRNASSGTPDMMEERTGLYVYSHGYRDNREYIRTPLADTLSPCTTYRFSMEVSRNDTYAYATDAIGIAVTDTFGTRYDRLRLGLPWAYRSPRGAIITGAPVILCGTLTPSCCATQLLIGNFDADTSSTLLQVGSDNDGPFAYYYVDNVHLNVVAPRPGCVDSCGARALIASTDLAMRAALPDHFALRFDSDSDEPLNEFAMEIDRVIALLDEDPALTVRIIGHADDSGTPAHNDALAQARADRLRSALMQRGAQEERIITASAGSSDPIADNATPEGRAMNRRVEVEVVR